MRHVIRLIPLRADGEVRRPTSPAAERVGLSVQLRVKGHGTSDHAEEQSNERSGKHGQTGSAEDSRGRHGQVSWRQPKQSRLVMSKSKVQI